MKQPTESHKNTWLARCRYSDCNAVKVKCPVCKKPGHVTTHVENRDKPLVTVAIQHSHFLENVDAGRNMYCETNIFPDIPKGGLKTVFRLTPEVKRKIINDCTEMLK
jgi:hypothetical protein